MKVVVDKQNKIKKSKTTKRKLKFSDSSDTDSSTEIPYIDTDDDMDPEFDEETRETKKCIMCGEMGKDNELWFMCYTCKLWAHADCTQLSEKEAKKKIWVCDFCL